MFAIENALTYIVPHISSENNVKQTLYDRNTDYDGPTTLPLTYFVCIV